MSGRVGRPSMHRCPHCQQAALRAWQVRHSSREAPAECTACGRSSHVIASTASGIPAVCLLLVAAAVLVGAVCQSVGAALAVVLLVPLYHLWAWRRVELWPVSERAASAARKVSWIVSLGSWLAILLS